MMVMMVMMKVMIDEWMRIEKSRGSCYCLKMTFFSFESFCAFLFLVVMMMKKQIEITCVSIFCGDTNISTKLLFFALS